MPGQVAFKDYIQKYKYGDPINSGFVRQLSDEYLNNPAQNDKDRELINAYHTGEVSNLEVIAHSGEMLNKRVLLGMRRFDEEMGAEFGEAWTSTEGLPYGKRLDAFFADPSVDRQHFRDFLDARAMDAFFRAGMSSIANMGVKSISGVDPDNYKGCNQLYNEDGLLSARLFEDTLAPVSPEHMTNLSEAVGEDEARRMAKLNEEQQLMFARSMFAMQLGGVDLKLIKGGSQAQTEDETMGNLLAHGGRVMFTLPPGSAEEQDNMLNSIVGEGRGVFAGTRKRSAATHAVDAKVVGPDGKVLSFAKESRGTTLSDNYGMNFAAGGLGRKIDNGKTVTNDGMDGHAYLKVQPGDERKCGQILLGLETSEPGKANKLGLMHDWHAKSAVQSPFRSSKFVPGTKYGGREVDLSNLSPQTLQTVMNRFDRRCRELQMRGDTAGLKEMNSLLCGKAMGQDKLEDFLHTQLGFSKESAKSIVRDARGYGLMPGRNRPENEKFRVPENERAADLRLNRAAAAEAALNINSSAQAKTDPAGAQENALASEGKLREMRERLESLGTRKKMGSDSKEYEKLKTAAEELYSSMKKLKDPEGPKGEERRKLLETIGKQAEEVEGLAHEYARIRGKNRENPSFSTVAGAERYHSARGIESLARQMTQEIELVREAARDMAGPANSNTQINAGSGGRQNQAAEPGAQAGPSGRTEK